MIKPIRFLYKKGVLKITSSVIEDASKDGDIVFLFLGLKSKDFKIRVQSVIELSKFAKDNDLVYKEICKTINNDISIVSLNAINSLILHDNEEYEKWGVIFETKRKELINNQKIGKEILDYKYPDFHDLKIDQRIRISEMHKRNQFL